MSAFPNLKPRHVMMSFGLGAASTLLASWGELGLMFDALPAMPFAVDEPDMILILTAVIIAPFVEELAKPVGLYLLEGEERPALKLGEWAFLGLMAGLGFTIIENLLYSAGMLEFGTGAASELLLLRSLLPLHMIASSISAFGFGLWTKTRNAMHFAGCMLCAMLLHGLFNLAATVVG